MECGEKKKELRGGSIVEGEVASGVGRVDKGGYLLRFGVCAPGWRPRLRLGV
jgi:hypothetical protein